MVPIKVFTFAMIKNVEQSLDPANNFQDYERYNMIFLSHSMLMVIEMLDIRMILFISKVKILQAYKEHRMMHWAVSKIFFQFVSFSDPLQYRNSISYYCSCCQLSGKPNNVEERATPQFRLCKEARAGITMDIVAIRTRFRFF